MKTDDGGHTATSEMWDEVRIKIHRDMVMDMSCSAITAKSSQDSIVYFVETDLIMSQSYTRKGRIWPWRMRRIALLLSAS